MSIPSHPASRRGSVLLVVSGLSVLVVGLGLAFLTRMRADAEDNQQLMRDLQARTMLMAGCDYVLEAARVGYDADPTTSDHPEASGWIDVRPAFGGRPLDGPRDQHGAPLYAAPGPGGRPRWPAIGAAARCPMHVLRRPPYATAMTASYNRMATDRADPDFGKPYLRWPDPQPASANGWPTAPADPAGAAASVTAMGYAAFAAGDRRPRPESTGLSWFRCYRESASVFVVTCGAGSSLGFRDWADVTDAPSHADLFGNDRVLFERIVADEVRLWYRIEWSDAIGSISYGGFLDNEIYPEGYANAPGADQCRSWDHWLLHPVNATQRSGGSRRNNVFRPNHCGTIRWVQRLDQAPAPVGGVVPW